MRRVYIAGPMTGYKDLNHKAFNKVSKRFIKQGWDVVNPAKFDDTYIHILTENEGIRWTHYLSRDIVQLATCEKVFFLRGWEKSYGARVERLVALKLGLNVEYEGGGAQCLI